MPLRLALRRASWVVVLGVLLAGLPRGGRGEDAPKGGDQARREVERLLEQSAQARKRSDLVAARALAAQAFDQARRSLRDDDPAQIRAAMAHFGPLSDEAMRKGDFGRALSIAGMAATFAGERLDYKTASQWTQYARDLAATRLKPGDPVRTDIEIAHAEFQTRDAMRARDRDRAYTWGKRADELARSLGPGNPIRERLLTMFAEVEFWRVEDAAALKLCEEVEEETRLKPEGNANNRVEALIREAGLLAMGDGPIPPEIAPKLAEALRRAFGDQVDPRAGFASRVIFWDYRLARALDASARGTPVGEVEGRLARDLGRFEAILRDAQVAPAVAALGGMSLALFQLRMQRIAAAETTLRGLEWAIKDPRITPASVGVYWIKRGAIEVERANYDVGREDFEIALRQEASPAQQAQALNNLGDLLNRQGDYPAAIERLERAIALYPGDSQNDPNLALALRNLADARDRLGRPDEAERLRRRAIAIAEAALPPDPYVLYLCRNSLGHGHYKAGKFNEARIEFEQSRVIAVKAFSAVHFHVAEAGVNLGWIAFAEGRTADAAASFQEALAIFREALGQEHPRIAEVLSYIARVHAVEGRGEQARTELEDALTLRERTLDRILRSAFSERDRLALVQEIRVHPEASAWPGVLDTYLDLAQGLGISVQEQYRRILTWKGVLARHSPPRVDEMEDDPEVRRLAIRREELLPKLRNATFLDSRGEQARTLEVEVDTLERKLRERSQKFQRGAGTAALGIDQVGAALPPRSALLDVIEIRRYRPRNEGEPLSESRLYVAMLIRGDRPLTRIDLGDAAKLDDTMKVFVEHLVARDKANPEAGDLAGAIRAPLVSHLDGIETLVVSADGLLNRLPWGALPGRRPGTFWVDELTFASIPSAQSLVNRRRAPHPIRSGALIVGGVDYGAAPAGNAAAAARGPSRSRLITRWPALGETLNEARSVERIFRETHPGEAVDLLTGDRASKAALRAHLADRRLIHLATHGYFDAGRDPIQAFGISGVSAQFDSYVVLAGANREGVDALLTAEEVGRFDLRGVELAVLSACQSGLGHVRAGQGDVGLLGALDRAGVLAVVSTLWEVGDEPTNALMQAFYRHLWSADGREGPAAALRAAQREMIQGTVLSRDGESFAHPHDWAAFVLGGDPASTVRP
jgi:CHAT domain-containing protein/Tfp pilus assembly protein PilF